MAKNESYPVGAGYVPREVRLRAGFFYEERKPRTCMHEIVEHVPVVLDNGQTVFQSEVVRMVPAFKNLKQYKIEDFKIQSLLAAGVPLSEVTFNLNSRVHNEELVSKAVSLGVLSEEFAPGYADPVVEIVEPKNE